MLQSFAAALAVACAALVAAVPAVAAPDQKSIPELIFDTKHIAGLPAGTELNYTFERKPSDETRLGAAFKDSITVKVESEAPDNKKNVMLQIYTGERARDPHRITDMDGNPMLVVYLDNAVAHFRDLGGGDRDYLKNTFKRHFIETAKLDTAKIKYKGDEFDGYKVTLSPYANDPARRKMRGYEGATFSIYVSEKIPGFFAKMVSNYTNSNKDSPTLEETTTLDGVEEAK
jgi:hypothetical protein